MIVHFLWESTSWFEIIAQCAEIAKLYFLTNAQIFC